MEATRSGEPPRKKVKREESDSEEDRKPDAVVSSVKKEDRQRVSVEFLFRSYKTHLFPKEGAFKGTLHLEMDQNPVTGLTYVPVGKTPFRVTLDDVETDSWCWGKEGHNEFTGMFARNDLEGDIDMETGLFVNYYSRNHRNFKAAVLPRGVNNIRHPQFGDIKVSASKEFEVRDLREWERGQGGFMEFVADIVRQWSNYVRWGYYGGKFCEQRAANGHYKIKLYTVLSAHKPNEDALPKYRRDKSPDWDGLVLVVAARNPTKDALWAENAVRQYR